MIEPIPFDPARFRSAAAHDLQGVRAMRHRTPAALLIDRALSMSRSSRERLGQAGVERLQAAITQLVNAAACDGMITEVVESTALIACRPA